MLFSVFPHFPVRLNSYDCVSSFIYCMFHSGFLPISTFYFYTPLVLPGIALLRWTWYFQPLFVHAFFGRPNRSHLPQHSKASWITVLYFSSVVVFVLSILAYSSPHHHKVMKPPFMRSSSLYASLGIMYKNKKEVSQFDIALESQ